MSKLPNWLRAGVVTSFFTAFGTFVTVFLGWLADVQKWVDSGGSFPSPSALGSAVVSIVIAVVAGGMNAFVRYAQEQGWMGGSPPSYNGEES
jgi:hypothetical protein